MTVEEIEPRVHQVTFHFGFMEDPDVPANLAGIEIRGHPVDEQHVTYFIGRESVIQGDPVGMHPLFEHLFVVLDQGALSASRFFRLPPSVYSRSGPTSRSEVARSRSSFRPRAAGIRTLRSPHDRPRTPRCCGL